MVSTAVPRKKKVGLLLSPERKKGAALLWWMLSITIVGGWFYPYMGFLLLTCMIVPVAVSAVRGRYWCGWVCPRGSFLDYIMARFSRNKPAPKWLRSGWFRVGMIVFLFGMMGTRVYAAWPDLRAIGSVFISMLTVTTVVAIVLALLYRPRTWCTFCPTGTISNFLGRGKKPLQVASTCKSCGVCAKVCPMDLQPHKPDASHADCLKCEQCIDRCKLNALSRE